jgi:cell division protein FtsL
MKKHFFVVELIKSPPFLMLLVLALLIAIGVMIANHKQKSNVIKMKEEVIYVHPETKK